MNNELLERVLACKRLPTMPAVAARVIELAGEPGATLLDMAEAIRSDAALAAKLLRTVNSSFFGLRRRCSTIDAAVALLGFSTVRSLALGFSLITSMSIVKDAGSGLDYRAFWRRSLQTGVAARLIARAANVGCAEEAFLGGLLQDIGVVAMHQALGEDYDRLLRQVGDDHSALSRFELTEYETQHGEVGALLASRWRLPDELIMPIRFHERPTAAPPDQLRIVRAVALGNIVADFLAASEPAGPLARYIGRAEQWFGLSREQAEGLLVEISNGAAETARLLEIDTGDRIDAAALLDAARKALQALNPTEGDHLPGEVPVESPDCDVLTGLLGRKRFDQTAICAYERAATCAIRLALAIFEIDGIESINETYGRDAGDCLVAGVGGRLEQVFLPLGLHVYRFQGPRFAVLLPSVDRLSGARAVETAQIEVARKPVQIVAGSNAPRELPVTISAGFACFDESTAPRIDCPSRLIHAAVEALAASAKSTRAAQRAA